MRREVGRPSSGLVPEGGKAARFSRRASSVVAKKVNGPPRMSLPRRRSSSSRSSINRPTTSRCSARYSSAPGRRHV